MKVRGSEVGTAKLTETDIVSIRRLRQQRWKLIDIAARFGVDKATVVKAVSGATWAHVSTPPAPEASPQPTKGAP